MKQNKNYNKLDRSRHRSTLAQMTMYTRIVTGHKTQDECNINVQPKKKKKNER